MMFLISLIQKRKSGRRKRKVRVIKNNIINFYLKLIKTLKEKQEEKNMAKNIISVEEVLNEMTASRKENGSFNYNRFNKKNFEKLMKAMLNDPDFTTEVAKAKKGDLDSVESIAVTQGFRKFCKRVIEKSGVDKKESERILTDEFSFDNVDGLYEFFATALYLYIEKGNRFDLIPKKNFKGSIALKNVKKSTKTTSAHSPQTREYLGDFEVTKEEHNVLVVKSSCPAYLKSRKKVK